MLDFEYKIVKSNRKSTSIEITQKGEVIIHASNFTPDFYIQNFIKAKSQWIKKKLSHVNSQNQLAKEKGLLKKEEITELKKIAKSVIGSRVEYFSKITGISYSKITIRCQKGRWGSCSSKGNLNFNCLLAMMPPKIIDSVVVHELVHRHHMNHSKAFYDEVLSIMPDYFIYDKWLKENGLKFLNRLP